MAGPPREKLPPLAAARPDCATPFVVLELADVTLAVTEDWLLGALVPSADVAEKLAAVIRAGVKGQKPQITCGEPRIRYTVPINLETGEAVK